MISTLFTFTAELLRPPLQNKHSIPYFIKKLHLESIVLSPALFHVRINRNLRTKLKA